MMADKHRGKERERERERRGWGGHYYYYYYYYYRGTLSHDSGIVLGPHSSSYSHGLTPPLPSSSKDSS